MNKPETTPRGMTSRRSLELGIWLGTFILIVVTLRWVLHP